MSETASRLPILELQELSGLPPFDDNTELKVLKVETPIVDRMTKALNTQWTKTAEDCIKRAGELEEAAADLRERAEVLLTALNLTVQVKEAVLYEINARNRALSLALVQPPPEL